MKESDSNGPDPLFRPPFTARFVEDLGRLIALGREVSFSGQLEATPPSGPHLNEFIDAYGAFRRRSDFEIQTDSTGSLILTCVIVDLNNLFSGLRACRELADWAVHSGQPSEAVAEETENLRAAFGATFEYLEEIKTAVGIGISPRSTIA